MCCCCAFCITCFFIPYICYCKIVLMKHQLIYQVLRPANKKQNFYLSGSIFCSPVNHVCSTISNLIGGLLNFDSPVSHHNNKLSQNLRMLLQSQHLLKVTKQTKVFGNFMFATFILNNRLPYLFPIPQIDF